jgi:hypothetical protein
MDLAVKFRFFRHLIGGNDPDSERVYRWHIDQRSGHRIREGIATDQWKLSLTDYVVAAKMLLESMRTFGFRPKAMVPVDPDGELLGGAHRVACALALGIKEIPILRETRKVWAPPWDWGWFVEKGMMFDDLERLLSDWEAMK